MQTDFFIIGQGLAGTTLAWHLLEAGAHVKIVDQGKKHTSSWAAAGLYNPVTGRKMVKTWMADQLFPYLQHFYRRIEKKTHTSFLHAKPIYRPFISIEEQNDWLVQANNKAYAPFVEQVASKSLFPESVHDPHGGLLLKQCGYLEVNDYLDASRRYFQQIGIYQKQAIDYQQLSILKNGVKLIDQPASTIIFCEGPDASSNPFFNWLPFSPVKGELLLIKPAGTHEVVYNRGIFVLPIGDLCKVGSTYNHEDLTYQPTESGRQYLQEKLEKLCKFRYEIVGPIAGVRPATRDRKPFIGIHPMHKPLAIFNGLGTKGVSLAPYFARTLTELLIKGQPLNEAVNIERFYHLYK
jgi:glycine/D-amino acid oxidase-like deaminating enzyme